jgi:hypothetical protein
MRRAKATKDKRARFQKRKLIMGLCRKCREPRMSRDPQYCVRHWIIQEIKNADITRGNLGKIDKRKRDRLLIDLIGIYEYVRNNLREPSHIVGSLREARDLRERYGIKWHGGPERLAMVIRKIEKKAMEMREQ